jgi:hypothetical protein
MTSIVPEGHDTSSQALVAIMGRTRQTVTLAKRTVKVLIDIE